MKLFIACILYLHLLSVYTDTSPNYCYVKSNATALALSFSTKTAYQKVKGTQDEIFYLPSKYSLFKPMTNVLYIKPLKLIRSINRLFSR